MRWTDAIILIQWCPPCMKLLPEFRKASAEVDDVNFGVVDCTIHEQICREVGSAFHSFTEHYSRIVHLNITSSQLMASAIIL